MTKELKYRVEQRLLYGDVDANFNRLMHFSSVWSQGTEYTAEEIVFWDGGLWRCIVASTYAEPIYLSSSWTLITPNPGLGTMDQLADVASTIPTTGSWQTVYFDQERYTPYGCSFDLVNNTFQFLMPGMWDLNIYVAFTFSESQSGRSFKVRLYDETNATGTSGVDAFVGRNVDGFTWATMVRVIVDEDKIGDVFRLEIGDASASFSGVQQVAADMSLTQQTPRLYVPIVPVPDPVYDQDYQLTVGTTLSGGRGWERNQGGAISPDTIGDPLLGQTQADLHYFASWTGDGLTDGFKIHAYFTDPGITNDLEVTIPGFGTQVIPRMAAGEWYGEWAGVFAFLDGQSGNVMTVNVKEVTP